MNLIIDYCNYSVSHANSSQCCDEVDTTRSDKLRSFIHDYFEETAAPVLVDTPTLCPEESQVRSDIRNLGNWLATSVLFHSPNFILRYFSVVQEFRKNLGNSFKHYQDSNKILSKISGYLNCLMNILISNCF